MIFGNMNMNEKARSVSKEQQRKEELSAYEKLVELMREQLEKSSATMDAGRLTGTIDHAARDLRALGEHSMDAISTAAETARKDLASTAEHAKPLWETLQHNANDARESMARAGAQLWAQLASGTRGQGAAWRDLTGSVLETFFDEVSSWSGKLAGKLEESITYHTGQMSFGGAFKCSSCKEVIHLRKPGHLPPCPKCHKTAYRRTVIG